MCTDYFDVKELVYEPFDDRERQQREPRQEAQYQPKPEGIRTPANESEPASEPVERPAEQRELLTCCALFHRMRSVITDATFEHGPSPCSPLKSRSRPVEPN